MYSLQGFLQEFLCSPVGSINDLLCALRTVRGQARIARHAQALHAI